MLMAGVSDNDFHDFQFNQEGIECAGLDQEHLGTVPSSWILMDNQSTVNVFYNKNIVKNIRESP
jgi:hypothetical protein